MNYKAIIFDLDGVICFTDEYHYLAWKALADSLNIPFDRTVNNRLRGVSRMDCMDIILEGWHGEPISQTKKEELASQKNALYRSYLEKMSKADLPEEVRETLFVLREKGLKLAIGSSSKNAPLILERIGLADFFDAVSDGNNISRSKPDPEVFLKAAQFIGLEPADCLVVEDAVSGAEAGKRGGFDVACLGDAAQKRAGNYNLNAFRELLNII